MAAEALKDNYCVDPSCNSHYCTHDYNLTACYEKAHVLYPRKTGFLIDQESAVEAFKDMWNPAFICMCNHTVQKKEFCVHGYLYSTGEQAMLGAKVEASIENEAEREIVMKQVSELTDIEDIFWFGRPGRPDHPDAGQEYKLNFNKWDNKPTKTLDGERLISYRRAQVEVYHVAMVIADIELFARLLNVGKTNFVKIDDHPYWGVGKDGKGANCLGVSWDNVLAMIRKISKWPVDAVFDPEKAECIADFAKVCAHFAPLVC